MRVPKRRKVQLSVKMALIPRKGLLQLLLFSRSVEEQTKNGCVNARRVYTSDKNNFSKTVRDGLQSTTLSKTRLPILRL